MDIRRIEQVAREDPSEETKNLTNRWKELTTPEEYRTSNGEGKIQPAKTPHHIAEQKRIETALNQK